MIRPRICPGYSLEYSWIKSGVLQFTNVNCYICNNFNQCIMAVIKSSALGQARKSIGPTNYYRRAGVQIARSKPVFAPGRTFTPAQLNQQFKMQCAQYALLTAGLGKCSKCANVINNRLYNSSSRYNRLVKQLLNCDWEEIELTNTQPSEVYEYYPDVLMRKWSIGDVKGGPSDVTIQKVGSRYRISLVGMQSQIDELIRLTNRRRRPSGYLSRANIGVCGVIKNGNRITYENIIVQPGFENDDRPVQDDSIVFYVNLKGGIISSDLPMGSFVVFIADGSSETVASVDIVALHCTDNTDWQYFTVVTTPDRPEIE